MIKFPVPTTPRLFVTHVGLYWYERELSQKRFATERGFFHSLHLHTPEDDADVQELAWDMQRRQDLGLEPALVVLEGEADRNIFGLTDAPSPPLELHKREPTELIIDGWHREGEVSATPDADLLRLGSGLATELMRLEIEKIALDRIQVVAHCRDDAVEGLFSELLKEIGDCYPEARKAIDSYRPASSRDGAQAKQPGRPRLPEEEQIYRLAKTQEAIKLRENTGATWAEAAKEVGWRHGLGKSAIKLMHYERDKLARLAVSDPDGFLEKVAEFRRKEKK